MEDWADPMGIPWNKSLDKIAADRLADEVASLVARGLLDSRSAAADALLDYREPPRTPRSDRLAEVEQENERLKHGIEALRKEASDAPVMSPPLYRYTVTTDWSRPLAGTAKDGDIEIMEIQVAATGGSPRPAPGTDLVPAALVSAEHADALAQRAEELLSEVGHLNFLLANKERNASAERARIRRELLEEFARLDRLPLQWASNGLAEPILSLKRQEILDAVDRVCPEKE